MALIGITNAEKIWNFLIANGCNEYGAAGVMANLDPESGLDPHNLQNSYETLYGYTDESYTNAVDSGAYSRYQFMNDQAGYGLAQWTYWTRKRDLYDLVKERGTSIGDLESQLIYLLRELKSSYSIVFSILKAATSVKEASDSFMMNFERPADQSDDQKNKRAEIGVRYYNTFTGSTTGATTEKEDTMSTVSDVLSHLAVLAGEREVTANVVTVTKYYNAQGQPYCGYSIKYAMEKAGVGSILSGCSNVAYVPTLREWMDKQGWKVSNSEAQAGDIFVYGSDLHVGFVYQPISGTTVITLEGNATVYATLAEAKASTAGTGAFEGIGYKKRILNTSFKVYRPNYSGKSSTAASTTTSGAVTAEKTPDSARTAEFQRWLKSYVPELDDDGEYGPLTRCAAVTAWQTEVKGKYQPDLEVDGDYGPKCRAAIKGHSLKYGDRNNLVYIAQGLLYCKGYDPNGFDGYYGAGMRKAVYAFQNESGLGADYKIGADTFGALFA